MRGISETQRLLGQIDLTKENREIADLLEKREGMIRAVDEATARVAGLRESLSQEADSAALADALIAGSNASDAARDARDKAEARAEIQKLNSAAAEITQRIQSNRVEIDAVRDAAHRKAAEAFCPLIDEVEKEMRQAAEMLLNCFAVSRAVREATRGHVLPDLFAQQSLNGVIGVDKVLGTDRRDVAVPSDVVTLLKHLADMGPALSPNLITAVRAPN